LSSEASAGRGLPLSVGAAAPDEFYDAYTFNVESRSLWSRARRRFLDNRLAVAGLLVLCILFSAGLLASHLALYGYAEIKTNALSSPPTWAHPFGTDEIGRDYFSRVLYGIGTEARIALLVALFGSGLGVFIGTVAGYFGGVVGGVVMRVTDLLLTLPALVVLLTAASYLNATTPFKVSLLISCLVWMPLARITRATCLSLREREYVEAARAMGASDLRIIVRHVLPNAISTVAVAASLMTAGAIVLETTLSFLGFGIPYFASNSPKPQPSLGDVLSSAKDAGLVNWWGILFPGLAITLMVMSINFIGDGLRDALDPTARRSVAPRRNTDDDEEPG
jgi:peptide/nickel transport system permease protein